MATVPVPSFAPVTVAPAFVPTFSTSAPVAPTGGNLSVPTFLLNPTAAAPSLAADGFPPGELSRQIVESWDGEFCPLGYLCQDVRRVNCTVLRGVVLAYQFGDLLAGMHCPAGRPGYLNCERGSYCPDPETIIPCPSGMFCPYKTTVPEIVCAQCSEGALRLERETYGYVIVILVAVIVLALIVLTLVRRYFKGLYQKFVDLSSRVEDIGLRSIRTRERQKQLDRIKPKLDILAHRLAKDDDDGDSPPKEPPRQSLSGNFPRMSLVTPIIRTEGKLVFRAGRVFDEIDADHNGSLSFAELNAVMELPPLQLREFVRSMNEKARLPPDTNYVTKSTFELHFLDALETCVHFQPSGEEAAELFDEISGGKDHATPQDFYRSSMSTFLSDSQINHLLRRFRGIGDPSETSGRSESTRFVSQRKLSRTKNPRAIRKEVFVAHYPQLLSQITTSENHLPALSEHAGSFDKEEEGSAGVDIAFEDLCLTVQVGNKSINVVDHVTGRLQAQTMTALMGGSGAGKTSLLNALCGRAFYGEVSGTIKVNGHLASIEEHSSAVGFVPQDDIVYPELTVKENLMFSGRFQLPSGTPLSEIEDLADETLASLGLSRVADSIVGDVTRRGVSGGEKKRVNIGLELMSRPSAIFLDEPTSGLDASSALLVMKSLRSLVDNQRVTVCSVIHQPRKFIYDLFDSLVLLGVGGRMVYHGPTGGAEDYFGTLHYKLPPGESVADWLIDISSGRLAPEIHPDFANQSSSEFEVELAAEKDDAAVGREGPSGSRFEQAFEEAKSRRAMLYAKWKDHFSTLDDWRKRTYDAPEPFALPEARQKPTFWRQLKTHFERNAIVLSRNSFSLLIDTSLIVGAVALISSFDGVVEVTRGDIPSVALDNMVSGNPVDMVREFGNFFGYAVKVSIRLQEFALKIGVITGVLVGLTAAKAVTEKRLNFFREAGSGYDINAYFLALNVTGTLVHSLQMVLCSLFAFWLRDSIARWHSYYINFIMLAWLCVGWAMLIPLLVPLNNVVMATGFFMAFFGLLFSGGLSPVTYNEIYNGSSVLAVFSGFVSPTRYFIEGVAVAEHRCLPQQSGFTRIPEISANLPLDFTSFAFVNLGLNEPNLMSRSCNGFYWGVIPALLVGFTVRYLAAGVIHLSDRSKQIKKPVFTVIKSRNKQESSRFLTVSGIYLAGLGSLFGVCCWLILRS